MSDSTARATALNAVASAINDGYALFRDPRYGTELTLAEIEQVLTFGLERAGYELHRKDMHCGA